MKGIYLLSSDLFRNIWQRPRYLYMKLQKTRQYKHIRSSHVKQYSDGCSCPALQAYYSIKITGHVAHRTYYTPDSRPMHALEKYPKYAAQQTECILREQLYDLYLSLPVLPRYISQAEISHA